MARAFLLSALVYCLSLTPALALAQGRHGRNTAVEPGRLMTPVEGFRKVPYCGLKYNPLPGASESLLGRRKNTLPSAVWATPLSGRTTVPDHGLTARFGPRATNAPGCCTA